MMRQGKRLGKVVERLLLVRQEYEIEIASDLANTSISLTTNQWGIYAAVLGAAGYCMSPIYRGLTIQFKV